LKARHQHGKFKSEMQQVVPEISCSDENHGKREREHWEEGQHRKKSSENRPNKDASDD
jgi:hypothetical protein